MNGIKTVADLLSKLRLAGPFRLIVDADADQRFSVVRSNRCSAARPTTRSGEPWVAQSQLSRLVRGAKGQGFGPWETAKRLNIGRAPVYRDARDKTKPAPQPSKWQGCSTSPIPPDLANADLGVRCLPLGLDMLGSWNSHWSVEDVQELAFMNTADIYRQAIKRTSQTL